MTSYGIFGQQSPIDYRDVTNIDLGYVVKDIRGDLWTVIKYLHMPDVNVRLYKFKRVGTSTTKLVKPELITEEFGGLDSSCIKIICSYSID